VANAPLFTDEPATDMSYINLRAEKNEFSSDARKHCEELWALHEPHADREFLVEIRSSFQARYWEMYLTVCLIREGYHVCCPKPGPDVGIEFEGRRIWFEATCPTRGKDGAPDQVPEEKFTALGEEPVVQDVPNERMVLRYLNSISTKYREQYSSWLKEGTVSPEDAFMIAVNPNRLGHEWADTQPPRILQAAFAVGNPYIVIDRDSLKQVDSSYQFRDKIAKAWGAPVASGVFHLGEYRGLSALLCSRIHVGRLPARMGIDFQLVPNPQAAVPLPQAFRLPGTYYRVDKAEGKYRMTPELHP
jgi:hypothetical protein